MGDKSTQAISPYLYHRIMGRLRDWGWTQTKLAERTGESASNIHRMTERKVRKISYLPKLRKVLNIPEDELEDLWNSYAEDLTERLARIMSAGPDHAKDFLGTVDEIGAIYTDLQRAQRQASRASQRIRAAEDDVAEAEAVKAHAEWKARQAALEQKRRAVKRALR